MKKSKDASAARALPNRSSVEPATLWRLDRKSTRLNSSHQIISYAVFCLKKKNFNLQSLSTIPIPQTLGTLLVKPVVLPEIHTKDYFQRSVMRREYPNRTWDCPEQITPD